MSTWLTIQYLRACAALAVVSCHAYLELVKITKIDIIPYFDGRSGVDLFFVISGFIIWMTTFSRAQGPGGFIRRRLVRIVPLYWICTFGFLGLLLFLPGVFERQHFDLGHVLKSLLFIPHVDPLQNDEIYPLLQVGWTLNFEMFFYALFAVCLLLARPARRVLAMAAILGTLVIAGAILRPDSAPGRVYTDPLLLEFLAGLLISYAFTSGWRPPAALGYGLIAAAVLTFVVLNQTFDDVAIDYRALCWGVPAVLLVGGVAAIESARPIRHVASVHLMGDASYAVYLSHPFTIGACGWVWSRITLAAGLPVWVFVALGMLASTMAGLILHVCLERPIIGALRHRSDDAPSPDQPVLALQGRL